MLVLVIDTATAAVTAGIAEIAADAVTVRAERVTVDARRHGEALTPAVAACLDALSARPADLAAVVAGVGPGPFTGLRVGLMTAVAFGDALGLPTYPVCSLDAVARAAGAAEPLLVATDARRREVYWATYAADGSREHGPDVARPAAVHAWLDTAATPATRAVGTGASLYADVLGLPVRGPEFPTVAALAALAADRVRAGAASEPLTPLYLRRPDAVEPVGRKPVLAP